MGHIPAVTTPALDMSNYMTGQDQDGPKSEPIFYSDSEDYSMARVLSFRTHGCPDGAVYIGRAMSRFGLREKQMDESL
jgi:hypothetical protein